jgi:hypothetical protein
LKTPIEIEDTKEYQL